MSHTLGTGGAIMFVARTIYVLLLIGAGVLEAAPICMTGSLASYEALGSGGCMNGPYLVNDFTFSVLSHAGGAVPLMDTDITVTPTNTGPWTWGLNFASSGFSVTSGQSVQYLIGYTWDPHNIRSMDDLLDIAVTPPGLAKVTTDGCVGAAFTGSTCSTQINTVTVSDDGITPVLVDRVFFAPAVVPLLGIRNTIDLEGNTTGKAAFDSFSNEVSTPEPGTWMGAGTGLCMFLLGRRWRHGASTRLKTGQMSFDRLS